MKTIKSIIHDGIVSFMGMMMRHNYRQNVTLLHSSNSGRVQVTISCSGAYIWRGKGEEWFKDLAQEASELLIQNPGVSTYCCVL